MTFGVYKFICVCYNETVNLIKVERKVFTMLYNESPRWMAPLNLLAGFVGLLLALLTEFGAGVEFVGGAVVFMPLALLVVALSSLCCVFSTLPILRKSTTVLGALIRMGFAIGVPGAIALLTLISWNVNDIATLSFVYTLLFIGALTAFWWYHLFPLVDFVAAVMVGVMICTNYDLAAGLGAGALWLHRIVGLLAMVALIWGACRVIGSDGVLLGLAGLVVPLVTGIIWMVFESCNELSSQTWMIIPIAIVMAVSFYVFARIYDFWDVIKGGGSSSSGGGSYKAKDEDTIEGFVESRFENHSRAWNIGVVTKTGRFSNKMIIAGCYRVWEYHLESRPQDYNIYVIKKNVLEIARRAEKDFRRAHKNCPKFTIEAEIRLDVVSQPF